MSVVAGHRRSGAGSVEGGGGGGDVKLLSVRDLDQLERDLEEIAAMDDAKETRQSPSPPGFVSTSNYGVSRPPLWSERTLQRNANQPPPHSESSWGEFRLRAPPAETNSAGSRNGGFMRSEAVRSGGSSNGGSSRNLSESTTVSTTGSSGQLTPSSASSDDGKNNNNVVGGDDVESVICLKGADKTYGKKKSRRAKVLDGLDMTVKKGAIYGLLGASGCGKTTVLSCVVGRRSLDAGRIRVFGGVPGDRRTGVPGKRVGYMPQELALYPEFTIVETLRYFGRIYGMKRGHVDDEVEFLLSLLDLPDKDRIVETLSGGQQRRVSFAVSLLHNPELLILDEPTVGVDPMLRQNIWSHLLRLASEKGKTILITTHYIEEARQANVVGLMRHGRLLAEDTPSNLLSTHSSSSLEAVFLKLCVQDNTSSDLGLAEKKNGGLTGTLTRTLRLASGGGHAGTLSRKEGGVVYPGITAMADDCSIQAISYAKKPVEETEFQKIKRRLSTKLQWTLPYPRNVAALMGKNFIKMRRNLSQLLFVFLLPALEVVFFCGAIGRDPADLPLGALNRETPLAGNCSHVPDSCDFTDVGCRFFDVLFQQEALVRRDFTDPDEALRAVRDGEIWGVVETPSNFSKYFLKRLWSSIDADVETLNKSSINVQLDQSNQQVTFVLKRSISEGYSAFFRGLLTDCEFPEETGGLPLHFGAPVHGPDSPSFTDFMAPGIIILIVFFLALALTGEMFITEKRDGLLDRSWIAGVLPSEVLVAHVLTQFLTIVGQTAITLAFILGVFRVPCLGPVGWLVGLALLQGAAGMSYGLLLSSLCDSLATSMQLAIGSFYPMLLLSGILWPVEGMPWYLRKIAWYLPCTASCQAMRDVMARGWDIGKKSVYLGYASSISWIAVFLILCWLVIKVKST